MRNYNSPTNRKLKRRNDTERATGSNETQCTLHALAAGPAGRQIGIYTIITNTEGFLWILKA